MNTSVKFRDPKTGRVFDGDGAAFCGSKDGCSECAIFKAYEQVWDESDCAEIVEKNPIEAARLMGYEIIEDDMSTEKPNKSTEKPNKSTENVKKPLKDWTLGEVNDYCEVLKGGLCTSDCLLFGENRNHFGHCKAGDPTAFDLTEKPRWTEREIEDAKAIKRLWPIVKSISRRECLELHSAKYGTLVCLIDATLFPSLAPGESVTLDEIIGGQNETG